MDETLKSALNWIPVAGLTREEWVGVGMALKQAGEDVSVWDEWSRNDERYHPGECERIWKSFRGSKNPVTTGSIIKMAEDRGWTRWGGGDGSFGWNDVIEYDGDEPSVWEPKWDARGELMKYIDVLFDSDEYVAYVTQDVWQGDGKWMPSRGSFDRTAGELKAALSRNEDIRWAVGDWNEAAGAWIRFNPVDGKGVGNANVTAWRHALVECDEGTIAEQKAAYERLKLPIACLVTSGGKSLHAIVKVDARNEDEYRERVGLLYAYLKENGVPVDEQNKNPSRLSRMPGATRNGNRQQLLGTNLGCASWDDWIAWQRGSKLPPMVNLADIDMANPPKPPEELIAGILRHGHKMLITGATKAGKSFLLIELSIAIASGTDWLGFACDRGNVLYVNFEIDERSFYNRYAEVFKAERIDPAVRDRITVWNLRGYAERMDALTPTIIQSMMGHGFDAVIIDPLYKVITGDENSASDMAAFCNEFDKIATQTGASVIYCHHHSKGAQGGKKAQDRGSGSGVFARDPDAILDLIELELTDDQRLLYGIGADATAFEMTSSLREFRNIPKTHLWFKYPVHELDDGLLADLNAKPEGTPERHQPKNVSAERWADVLDSAYTSVLAMNLGEPVTVRGLCEYLEKSDDTVRRQLKAHAWMFDVSRGIVTRKEAGA